MTTATTTIQPSTSRPAATAPTKFRKDRRINWGLTAVVAVFRLTSLVPLDVTVVTALKTPAEAGSFSLPSSGQWGNFAAASAKVDYPRAALNSAIITVIAVSLTLVTNTFVAYAIARNTPTKFRKDRRINWWLTAVVAVFSLTILVPLYFTVVTALKTPAEAGSFRLPSSWQWGNFAAAPAKVDNPRAALNSAIITVIAVSLTLVTNTFVAYAIALNMDKRFFRFLYYFFIAAMFVPFPVVMLPLAKQMGSWHLDNQAGLIILTTSSSPRCSCRSRSSCCSSPSRWARAT